MALTVGGSPVFSVSYTGLTSTVNTLLVTGGGATIAGTVNAAGGSFTAGGVSITAGSMSVFSTSATAPAVDVFGSVSSWTGNALAARLGSPTGTPNYISLYAASTLLFQVNIRI